MRPRETHNYLKVLKSIDSLSQRQAMVTEKLQPSVKKQEQQRAGKVSLKKSVVEFLDPEEDLGGAAAADLSRFDDSDEMDDLPRLRLDKLDIDEAEEELAEAMTWSELGGDEDEDVPKGDGLDIKGSDAGSLAEADRSYPDPIDYMKERQQESMKPAGAKDRRHKELPSFSSDQPSSRRGDAILKPEASGSVPRAIAGPSAAGASQPRSAFAPVAGGGIVDLIGPNRKKPQLDLSRFGSDSDEEFRDIGSDEEERGDARMRAEDVSVAAAAPQQWVLASGGVKKPAASGSAPSRDPAAKASDRSARVVRASAKGSSPRGPAQMMRDEGLRANASAIGGKQASTEASVRPGRESSSELDRGTGLSKVAASGIDAADALKLPKAKKDQRGGEGGGSLMRPAKAALKLPAAPIEFSFSFVGGAADAVIANAAAVHSSRASAAPSLAQGSPGPRAAASMSFGLSFVRPRDKSDEELRAEWDAQRESLAADYKSKQRTALKHAGRGNTAGRRTFARR